MTQNPADLPALARLDAPAIDDGGGPRQGQRKPDPHQIMIAARATLIPEAESGLWSVKRCFLPRAVFVPKMGWVPTGTWTTLFRWTLSTLNQKFGEGVMNDTPNELKTHLQFMMQARGRVLVTGLGLGCVVRGLLANPRVDHVVVIEREIDVLKLVGPSLAGPRVTIIQADALTWVKKAPRRFDCAYHDLWTETDEGEPDLQIVHLDLINACRRTVPMQFAWKFPRELRRLCRDCGVI